MTRVLRLLLPSFTVVAREARGPMTLWLSRGDRVDNAAPGRASTIARAFDLLPRQPLAAAAVTRQAMVGDAADATWVRADPGHARADMANLRLMRCGDLAITRAEIDALLPTLRPLFGDDGFEFSAPDPDTWFLRGLTSTDAPETEDPADILGNDLHAHMPSQRKWLKLMNEAQVLLHHHPVNEARVANGQLAINTIWFWGSGKLPTRVATPFAYFATTDELLMGYARAAEKPVVPIAEFVAKAPDGEGGAVVEAWTRESWHAVLNALEGFAGALRRKQFDVIELDCWTGERFRYAHSNRWRVFRKVRNPGVAAS